MTLFQCQCDHCCDNGVVCAQLSCWRAHPAGISSVRCAEVGGEEGQEQDLLLVASQDCTVSLWSLQGGLVGVLGKHTWSLSNRATWQDAKVCKHAECVYSHLSLHYLCRLPVICVCRRGSLQCVQSLVSVCALSISNTTTYCTITMTDYPIQLAADFALSVARLCA